MEYLSPNEITEAPKRKNMTITVVDDCNYLAVAEGPTPKLLPGHCCPGAGALSLEQCKSEPCIPVGRCQVIPETAWEGAAHWGHPAAGRF